jgi:hypothetical protein|tara:strand:- start:118 stop:606 length:489 start_codon:yes stop_codon:yes gene_type:complete
MAETLDVASMLPRKFEPKYNNRWIFAIEGIDAYLIKTAARPSITISPLTLDYMNSQRHVAGRSTFGDLTVNLHDPIAPSGAQQVMEWARTHYESVSGRAGYADFYKRDAQLKLVDPIGTVIELWDLKGCILTSVGFGELAYGEPTMLEISLGIKFDNCVLQY